MNSSIRNIADYSQHYALSGSLVVCLSIAPSAAVVAEIGWAPAAAASGPALQATVNAGRLTLETSGAPLAEVLGAIGEAGSFRVVLRGTFAEPVNRSFTDEPLMDVIRRLVEGHSVVILRNDPDPASGAPDLAEIWVMENPALASPEPASTESKAADPQMSYSEPDVATEEAPDPVAEEEDYRQAVFGYAPPTKDDLLRELDDPDPAARAAVIPKVSALSPEEAIDLISHVFSYDDDMIVRSRALAALTRLEGSRRRVCCVSGRWRTRNPGYVCRPWILLPRRRAAAPSMSSRKPCARTPSPGFG
jgi:hypothetical protein